MSSPDADITAEVKSVALEEGFAAVGIAPASGEPPHARRYLDWLSRRWNAEMAYMERGRQIRLGVRPIMEGARSVICLAAGYGAMLPSSEACARETGTCDASSAPSATDMLPRTEAWHPAPDMLPRTEAWHHDIPSLSLVARYARGRDYHKVLKKKCRALMDRLRAIAPSFDGHAFVDWAPVSERTLAAWAGVGWIGRNGCLIVPGRGSFVLLCEIACKLPLAPDAPIENRCGDCRACVDACPTGAIAEDSLIDARRCVSYLTIECRGEIPREFRPPMGCRLFGCDRCQEVCPHNRPSPSGKPQSSGPHLPIANVSLAEVLRWSREDWDAATRGSATRRATWEMFLRNASIAAGNSQDTSLIEPLSALRRRRPELAEVADWAVRRLSAGREK